METPPHHRVFDEKGADKLAGPSLLQRRIAANQPAAPAAPTINNNFSFPEAILDFIRPPPSAASTAPAAAAPANPSVATEQTTLLPPNMKVGERLTVLDFCRAYDLDYSISDKLTANGYKNSSVFYLIKLSDLLSMNFLQGEIAELREAVRSWAAPAG